MLGTMLKGHDPGMMLREGSVHGSAGELWATEEVPVLQSTIVKLPPGARADQKKKGYVW